MGLSKTEVNLRRLLAAAPQQQNHGKLIHVCSQSSEVSTNSTSYVFGVGDKSYSFVGKLSNFIFLFMMVMLSMWPP